MTSQLIQSIYERALICPTTEHINLPTAKKLLTAKLNIYAYGPSGSGKTLGFIQAAESLGIKWSRAVMSPTMMKSDILGYLDANSNHVKGPIFERYVEGGLYIADEIDNGNAAGNVVHNAITDGGSCYFPVGMTPRHSDFYVVATANTVGNGASKQYVGRCQQDKSLLNRFVFLKWSYDENFEISLAIKELDPKIDKNVVLNWLKAFYSIRDSIDELKINHILSTRNLIQMTRMLNVVFSDEEISRSCIFRELDEDSSKKLLEHSRKKQEEEKKHGLTTAQEYDFYPIIPRPNKDLLETIETIEILKRLKIKSKYDMNYKSPFKKQ